MSCHSLPQPLSKHISGISENTAVHTHQPHPVTVLIPCHLVHNFLLHLQHLPALPHSQLAPSLLVSLVNSQPFLCFPDSASQRVQVCASICPFAHMCVLMHAHIHIWIRECRGSHKPHIHEFCSLLSPPRPTCMCSVRYMQI